jgi:large subunit ribosomal protein L20
MARVKRGTKRRARRKKYLKRTKGFFLTKSKLYQSAQEAANRADRYAYRDRRNKKRQYRRLWIQRIGAAARLNGLTYGQLKPPPGHKGNRPNPAELSHVTRFQIR